MVIAEFSKKKASLLLNLVLLRLSLKRKMFDDDSYKNVIKIIKMLKFMLMFLKYVIELRKEKKKKMIRKINILQILNLR
jgi:hypothetical protein